MPEYIDKQYFGDVTKMMLKRGFALFGFTEISTDEGFRHHVDAPNARDTRLFFHYPNKSLIVVLGYKESDDPDNVGKPKGYWTIRFYHQFVDIETLVKLTLVPKEERSGIFDEDFRKVIFHDFSPTPEHFAWRGNGEMCELYCPDEPTSPEIVVDEIWNIAEQALPYLANLPFEELQVTSFPPYYTFPGCEQKFWEQFKESVDKRYLWSLAERPWGSDGLKR